MNERIKELAEQAGAVFEKTNGLNDCPEDSLVGDEIEKFAELIVKECLEQIDKIRDGHKADDENEQALGASWAGYAVAQHFGVNNG
jgi:hypothetical protein